METKILYKYVTRRALDIILNTKHLKFSLPEKFNDPFDVCSPSLFSTGYDQTQHLKNISQNGISIIGNMTDSSARKSGPKVFFVKKTIQNLSPKEYQKIQEKWDSEKIYDANDIQHLKKVSKDVLSQLKDFLSRSVILCLGESESNLLMWAHYADQHKGAVLGFKAEPTSDSFFLTSKKVKYSRIRPALYRS